jgi:hypothetical protein
MISPNFAAKEMGKRMIFIFNPILFSCTIFSTGESTTHRAVRLPIEPGNFFYFFPSLHLPYAFMEFFSLAVSTDSPNLNYSYLPFLLKQ